MRIIIRTSKWAIWARRLAGFSLPLIVIPVFMHRSGLMTTDTFHILEGLGGGIAALALMIGLGACVRLWFTGDLGWGRAFGGILLSLFCLAPFGLGIYLIRHYPAVTDISTDLAERPPMVQAMTPVRADLDALTKVEAAFPNARTRRYQLDAPTIFGLVSKLVAAKGWQVIETAEPGAAPGEGHVNAIAMTLVGWRDEVAIRVREDADGTSVAMRSVQLTGLYHDLGSDGLRIEDFLVALDNEVTQVMRNLPPPASADDADAAPEPATRPSN